MALDHRRSPIADRGSSFGVRLAVVLVLTLSASAFAQSPVTYRLSFPELEHHWMQVEIRFADVPTGTLQIHMSRSSPGRYAIHEFAKNVYDVEIDDGSGRALIVDRPNTSEWDVPAQSGTVRVRYRVFGNQTDGTYLGLDTTHAHINIPAALMWAHGLEDREARITFDLPAGKNWKVATELHPTGDPHTFAAANLGYLIDSPTELSNFVLRTFQVEQRPGSTVKETFRLALHHNGTDREADRLAADLERIVREESAVFGELPAYEGGTYTFIADYLPDALRDGMEHRNSAFLTSPGALRVPDERFDIVSTAAHEFFHCWNVKRIRPKSLEPFNLETANASGELWLAEGFTSYYEALVLQRTGLATTAQTAETLGRALDAVIRSAGRRHRSAEEMSRMAPFVDPAVGDDQTNFDNTYLSYYTWGTAIALGLDLSLRERSEGKITLDDFMRELWRQYGRAPGVEGRVPHPYTMQDLRDTLAAVSGERTFADDFFDRYVQGRDVVDYKTLLGRAGMLLKKRNPLRAWIGALTLNFDRGRASVATPSVEGTPAYAAGLDEGDELVSIAGEPIGAAGRIDEILRRHAPGETLRMTIRRAGVTQDLIVTSVEDPTLELVPTEINRPLTQSERFLRDAWLNSKR
jgi:predicted metalloprotease with PDZ domain